MTPQETKLRGRIRGEVEGLAFTSDEEGGIVRVFIGYTQKWRAPLTRILSEDLVLRADDYGGEDLDLEAIEKDVRKHIKDKIKELRKGLKPHPLMEIVEEEEDEQQATAARGSPR